MIKNNLTKIIAIVCTFAMLLPMLLTAVSAADFEYKYETPVDPGRWEEVNFDTDHAYSIAFVGDTQYITSGDRFLGTNKLKQEYKYIADTADERKLAHVFVLGDITDHGYRNDGNLAGAHNDPPVTKEWEIAQEAILQLSDAGVSYSLCRGNHDDYMMDDYFNIPAYTDQFKNCGGFFSDSDGKHPQAREVKNPDRYIYWSAISGYHKDSIVNSWKTMELFGVKYLFMTVDYNPTTDVLNWVDETLAKYPDHRAIITTHSYLNGKGGLITSEKGDTMYPLGNTADVLWNNVLKNHANVFMVVSGHVGVTDLVYSYNIGNYGNKVLQVLVDPQSYDAKESDSSGKVTQGTQDTGLVLYMNFSEDGNTISFNYYSTLLDKFLKGNKLTFTVNEKNEFVEWGFPDFDTDQDYSFAFVGDTQHITCGDYYLGTNKLEKQYKYIADTAKDRKLEHVFVLGDITDLSYKNDPNLSSNSNSTAVTKEWEIAQKAISQLDKAGVSYSLCRGDHDDYMIDDYFNVPSYTDQFKNGGFFTDPNAKYSNGKPVYWSAKTGAHSSSIVNSWKTVEIQGTKYLFITVDYNPTKAVLDWVDQILAKYPDHRAIITTHAYLDSTGKLIEENDDETATDFNNMGGVLWDNVLRKHANVFMIVSGHKGSTNLVYTFNKGDKGNKVLQVLVDPEFYDKKEVDAKGTVVSGTQDVGLVLYMNFSEGGNVISFNYYSTLFERFIKNNDYVIRMDDKVTTSGDVDLSGLEEFGQVTPVVTEKKTITLDGVVSEGEYSASKITPRVDIDLENLISEMTEYYAYDDEYLYYAFVVNTDFVSYKLNLHFGNSNFTFDELDDGTHNRKAVIVFGKDYCMQESNNMSSKMIMDKDFFCEASRNAREKKVTYEIKIRRGYLAENNVPDDVLAYTINFGKGLYRYKINIAANEYLKSLGVKSTIAWTYNYAYFGAKHSLVEELPPEDTTAATDDVTDTTGKKKGCKSTISLAPVACVVVALGTAIAVKKRKENG